MKLGLQDGLASRETAMPLPPNDGSSRRVPLLV
jgi:hypothetical protein